MAKLKKTEFKKYLAQMTKEEMAAEMLKLFERYEQVQNHYTQDLGSDAARETCLETYKKKLNAAMKSVASVSPIKIRQIISEFKQISVFPYDLARLLLHRAKCAIELLLKDHWNELSSSFFQSSYTSFKEFCILVRDNLLYGYFDADIETLFTSHTGYYEIDFLINLIEVYNEHYGKNFPYQVEFNGNFSTYSWVSINNSPKNS